MADGDKGIIKLIEILDQDVKLNGSTPLTTEKLVRILNVALDGLFRRMYDKVIITRPTVSKEEIGFLPGDLREKMDPWVQPIYQNMFLLYDKSKVERYIEKSEIEIVPVSFMRGRTFLDSCIIVDEAQNVTNDQMEMIVTRLGKGSKMIVCGDTHQVDLKKKEDSGFKFLYNGAKKIKEMQSITLVTNNRADVVQDLIDYYNDAYDQNKIVGTAGSSGAQRR